MSFPNFYGESWYKALWVKPGDFESLYGVFGDFYDRPAMLYGNGEYYEGHTGEERILVLQGNKLGRTFILGSMASSCLYEAKEVGLLENPPTCSEVVDMWERYGYELSTEELAQRAKEINNNEESSVHFEELEEKDGELYIKAEYWDKSYGAGHSYNSETVYKLADDDNVKKTGRVIPSINFVTSSSYNYPKLLYQEEIADGYRGKKILMYLLNGSDSGWRRNQFVCDCDILYKKIHLDLFVNLD